MPPLYPKMRERPMEFRMNYDAPLAKGLVFAGLGGRGCVGSMVYPDSSPYHNHGTLTNMDAATDWVWVPELQRWSIHINTATQSIASTRSGLPLGHSAFTYGGWIAYESNTPGELAGLFIPGGPWCYSGLRNASFCTRIYNSSSTRVDVTAALATGVWTNCIFRADLVGENTCKAFRDGIEVSSNNLTGPAGSFASILRFDDLAGSCACKFADWAMWDYALPVPYIAALADPSNVDLRVGGVPLILPPRRRYWPVVSEQAIPKMVPWHLFQQVSA